MASPAGGGAHAVSSTAAAPPGGEECITVSEGGATLYFSSRKDVFYNHVQCTNRDLSMIMAKVFAKQFAEEAAAKAARRRGGGAGAPAAADADGDAHGETGGPPPGAQHHAAERAADVVSSYGVGGSGGSGGGGAAADAGATATAAAGGGGADAAAAPTAGAGGGADGGGVDGGGATAAAAQHHHHHAAPPQGLRILDALSASGLRALRYAHEVPGAEYILANDISAAAVAAIGSNAQRNGPGVAARVQPALGDAAELLYRHRLPTHRRFHLIDLDPYGTAAPFLDGAVQAVAEGGLLAVTCTDMAVLSGNHGEACFAKYGSYPLRGKHCHEMALRILLASIDSHAARYKRYIVPQLAVSIDFYVRVFVRVFTSAAEVKRAAAKRAYLYQCHGCEAFSLAPLGRSVERGAGRAPKFVPGAPPPLDRACAHCGRGHHIGGPLWAGPLHEPTAVAAALAELRAGEGRGRAGQPVGAHAYAAQHKLLGLLTTVSEELPDAPLYVDLSALCGVLHCQTPPLAHFVTALLEAGHRVSRTHASHTGLKTDAPFEAIWDVLRCWVRQNPVKGGSPTSPATAILARPPRLDAQLRASAAAARAIGKAGGAEGVTRFPQNPAPDWGPGTRKTAHTAAQKRPAGDEPEGACEGEAEAAVLDARAAKRARNQGKNAGRNARRRAEHGSVADAPAAAADGDGDEPGGGAGGGGQPPHAPGGAASGGAGSRAAPTAAGAGAAAAGTGGGGGGRPGGGEPGGDGTTAELDAGAPPAPPRAAGAAGGGGAATSHVGVAADAPTVSQSNQPQH